MAEEHDGTRQVHGEVEDSGLGGCGLAAELRCCQEHAAVEEDENGYDLIAVAGPRDLLSEVAVTNRAVGLGCVVGKEGQGEGCDAQVCVEAGTAGTEALLPRVDIGAPAISDRGRSRHRVLSHLLDSAFVGIRQ